MTFCKCIQCEKDIHLGDEIWEFANGDIIHFEGECFEEYVKDALGALSYLAGEEFE